MSFTPLRFTGISNYSADLQTVLDRSVAIASIPLKQLQNQVTDNLQKKTLLGGFNSALSSLESSVRNLGTLSSQKALAASSSNTSKVSVSYAGATSPATYTLSDITSIAKAATEASLTGYADSAVTAVSSTGTVKLTVGSTSHTITLGSGENNLVGLRDAINGLGAGVTATILTTGTGANPNYLSITADESGAKTLTLQDDPTGANTSLLTAANQGANLSFKLNGVSVEKSSNQVNDVVAGLTFSVKDTTSGSETVTLSLGTDRAKLSSAISQFVTGYNTVVDQINAQVGPEAGALSGDYIVVQTQNVLRKLSSFEGSGSIASLADLGLEFGADGQVKLDSTTFSNLSDSQIAGAFEFFDSATGLAALAEDLLQLADPVSGIVKQQLDGYDRTDSRLSQRISELEERISFNQASVAQKLQIADALLAQLNSQQNLLEGSLKAVSLALFGKNDE